VSYPRAGFISLDLESFVLVAASWPIPTSMLGLQESFCQQKELVASAWPII
jgi:hypothetical protein